MGSNHGPPDYESDALTNWAKEENWNAFIDHPEFAQVIWGDLTGITTYSKTPKTLIKVIDFLGKKVDSQTNKLLIYLYSDGSVEKRFETSNK